MKKIQRIVHGFIFSFLLFLLAPVSLNATGPKSGSTHMLILGQTSVMKNHTLLSDKLGITYHVVDPNILSVNKAGVITPLQSGTTDVLTFTGEKIIRSTYKVVGLTPTNPVVEVGKSVSLKLVTDSENLTKMKGIWQSENPYVAEVSSQGKVKAKSVGTTTISYSLPNHLVLKANICVIDAKVASSEDIYLAQGGYKAIKLTKLKNVNASALKWSTSAEKIATVNQSGTVTGKKAGNATIVCSYGSKHYAFKVHVVSMNPVILLGANDSYDLTLNNASSKVSWESSSTMIASVSGNNGTARVTAGGEPGTTIITATYKGVQVSTKIIVGKLTENILFMEKQDSYQPSTDGLPYIQKLNWASTDNSVATVDYKGKITAKHPGSAIIYCTGPYQKTIERGKALSISVNVIDTTYTGNKASFTYLGPDGNERTYHLYKQNAHNYADHDRYLAWHGCATCSTTTVLNCYTEKYKNAEPNEIINGLEKSIAGSEAWNRNYKEKKLKSQMPPSLYGISSMLKAGGVDNNYVRSYNEKEGKADIISHLKTGNPIIFEVRQKSNLTGKSSTRWTNSYHTMVMLGILTNNKILLCDSVDRSWYKSGGQRLKVVELSDLMEYMFSCTDSKNTMYFAGASSDGGYIKISETK